MNRRNAACPRRPLGAGRRRRWPPARRPSPPPRRAAVAAEHPLFPDDDQFWFETVRAFGDAEYGGGAVRRGAGRPRAQIRSGDYDSWYDAWNAAGERIAKEAEASWPAATGSAPATATCAPRPPIARSEFFLHGNPEGPADRRAPTRCRWRPTSAAPRLYDPPIMPVEIPYEQHHLARLFPPRGRGEPPAADVDPAHRLRRLRRGDALGPARAAAVERGYNVLVFDGPGQFGPIHREGLVFRPALGKGRHAGRRLRVEAAAASIPSGLR